MSQDDVRRLGEHLCPLCNSPAEGGLCPHCEQGCKEKNELDEQDTREIDWRGW